MYIIRYLFYITIIFISTFLFTDPLNAQNLDKIQLDQVQTIKQTQGLKFSTVYNEILDTKNINACLLYDTKEKTKCLDRVPAKLYIYNTQTPVEKLTGETARTKNTISYNNKIRVYSGDQFFNDGKQWTKIEYGIISDEQFKTIQAEKLQSIFWRTLINNPFKIYSVNAQDVYYSNGNAGYIYGFGHNNAGVDIVMADPTLGLTNPGEIDRSFIFFDTSALAGYTVTAATVSLFITADADDAEDPCYLSFAPAVTADPEQITITDYYDNRDQVSNTEQKAYLDLGDNTFHDWTFTDYNFINLTGFTQIMSRNNFDEIGTIPAGLYCYLSTDYNGSNKPYLTITVTLPEETCGDTICNGVETCLDCSADCGECVTSGTPGIMLDQSLFAIFAIPLLIFILFIFYEFIFD